MKKYKIENLVIYGIYLRINGQYKYKRVCICKPHRITKKVIKAIDGTSYYSALGCYYLPSDSQGELIAIDPRPLMSVIKEVSEFNNTLLDKKMIIQLQKAINSRLDNEEKK